MSLSPAGGAPNGSTILKVAPAAVGAAAVAGAIAAGTAGKSAAAGVLPPGVKTGNGRGVRPPGSIPRSIAPVLAAGVKPGVRPGLIAAPLFASKFPRIAGHRFAGRSRLPLYFVAGVFGFGSTYWAYRTSTTYVVDDPVWVRPVPSCYVGGSVFYREPGTGACFDFATAEPGDYFECNSKVYRWAPERAASVEDIVAEDDTSNRAVVYDDWVKTNPAYIRTKAARAPAVVRTSAPADAAQLDCSSCLGAQGPTETGNGMCTLTLANNCPQPISFKGGMSRATDDRTIACEFAGDVETGSQKTVCTAPCAAFDQAVTYITAATPKAGWTGTTRACRAVDPVKAAAARARSGDGAADIYAPPTE